MLCVFIKKPKLPRGVTGGLLNISIFSVCKKNLYYFVRNWKKFEAKGENLIGHFLSFEAKLLQTINLEPNSYIFSANARNSESKTCGKNAILKHG